MEERPRCCYGCYGSHRCSHLLHSNIRRGDDGGTYSSMHTQFILGPDPMFLLLGGHTCQESGGGTPRQLQETGILYAFLLSHANCTDDIVCYFQLWGERSTNTCIIWTRCRTKSDSSIITNNRVTPPRLRSPPWRTRLRSSRTSGNV